MRIYFIFLFLISCVSAVPIAGSISGSNGSLPLGRGTRPIQFPNQNYYPGSTITCLRDYQTFVVAVDGIVTVNVLGDVGATEECSGYIHLNIFRVDTGVNIRKWEILGSQSVAEIATFRALSSSQYQLQLEGCHGGNSSISNTAISWFQPTAA